MRGPLSGLGMWLFRKCPLLKACRYNESAGFETWWRGVIVGPLAIGVLWRTAKPQAVASGRERVPGTGLEAAHANNLTN